MAEWGRRKVGQLPLGEVKSININIFCQIDTDFALLNSGYSSYSSYSSYAVKQFLCSYSLFIAERAVMAFSSLW